MERERRVNPECPNASNPFHRCAEYCAPRSPAAAAAAAAATAKPRIESPKSDPNGDRTRTRDEKRRGRRGGSGGLPLYVFLQNGSTGETRKVDSRCPNASNPFHVCAEYCFTKLNEINRREGSKSPSFLSRHSSSSSAEDDVNLGGNRRVDPRCANASNPFHVCADYCFNKSHENNSHEISRAEPGTPVANGVKMGKTRSNGRIGQREWKMVYRLERTGGWTPDAQMHPTRTMYVPITALIDQVR
uniref:Uncharacterized protein n=1 Tax=Ananas comosus var. bracteatus TaxID=296719 RepID=A0A6V7PJW6_ANACO|nr:unnamed protein product [Ananas comosus var. bracteatus]